MLGVLSINLNVVCRSVRKSAVQLLSAAAHNKPALIVDQLPGALPHLFAQVGLLGKFQLASKQGSV